MRTQPQSLQSWDQSKGVFSRSGLTGSQNVSFTEKLSLHALEQFVSTLGSFHFLEVIREDRDAFVYVLGDDGGKPSHVVAWRPISNTDANHSASVVVSFNISYMPAHAWKLGVSKYTTMPLPTVSSDGIWTMRISEYPVAVSLSSVSWRDCPSLCSGHGGCYNGTCICDPGFVGTTCSNIACEQNCWQKGVCQPDGSCICYKYYTSAGSGEYQRCRLENMFSAGKCRDSPAEFDAGSSCYLAKCLNNCNNAGTCTAQGCVCNIGWSGSSCSVKPCPHNCRSHGICNNGTCKCNKGFTGSSCEWSDSPRLVTTTCPLSTPFKCTDGTCALSLGACALKSTVDSVASRWDAQLYTSAAIRVSQVSSSSASSAAYLAGDGNENTFWQSGTCFPTGFVQYPGLNLLYGACASGRCSSSSGATLALTDGDFGTASVISAVGGLAYFRANLESASTIVSLSVRSAAVVVCDRSNYLR